MRDIFKVAIVLAATVLMAPAQAADAMGLSKGNQRSGPDTLCGGKFYNSSIASL